MKKIDCNVSFFPILCSLDENQVFNLVATVSIDLGSVRKLVMVGRVLVNVPQTQVKNVHSGANRNGSTGCFQITRCCEHSTAETGIFTQLQMNALCHVAQMDVK